MARDVFVTHSAEETIERGREIGQRLRPPVLILLAGDLGAGKTTLAKGIASGLGAAEEDQVTSPTFTLVHQYDRDVRVYHVDLYRITSPQDFETLGLEDIFDQSAAVIVEWSEHLRLRTDWPIVRIELDHLSENERRISVEDTRDLL